ncbi:hypothetical protein K501DRAFT_275824 [Backusella circina FSU 941]|nr:hypothetical protein K501DRAFT_275824 [Backusella circina FSU 941]
MAEIRFFQVTWLKYAVHTIETVVFHEFYAMSDDKCACDDSRPYKNNHRKRPDEYWYLPPGNTRSMFGGDEKAMDKVKQNLAFLCKGYEYRQYDSTRKGIVWDRLERELTGPEKQSSFVIPNADVPVNLIIGIDSCNFHRIIHEYMTYLWYEDDTKSAEVPGPDESNVGKATSRVRNHYLKLSRKWVSHSEVLMQKPKANNKTLFIKKPSILHSFRFIGGLTSLLLKKIDMNAVLTQPHDRSEHLIDLFAEYDVNEKVPSLSSALSSLDASEILFTPYITNKILSFEDLLRYFSLNDKDASQVTYLIRAYHYFPTSPSTRSNPNNENSSQVLAYSSLLSVTFTQDNSIKFLDCALDEGKEIENFQCVNAEDNYV